MCLIAFAWNAHPHYAVALIANRDEFHARPAAPAAWQSDDSSVIGGVDLQAGGSWLQVSRRGRLAAVTNYRDGLNPPPTQRSRGTLVVDFVRSKHAAAEFALANASTGYAIGRHTLLTWDGSSLWQSGNYPAAHAAAIAPGLHVLSNADLDAPWPKSQRVQMALARWLQVDAAKSDQAKSDQAQSDQAKSDQAKSDQASLEPLFAILADATQAADPELPCTGIPIEWERRLSSPFIHGSDYGTRCSTVILISHSGEMTFEERRFGPQGVAAGATRWRGGRLRE